MPEPWERALRNCIQQVPDESDLDYEPGVMGLRPLKERVEVLSAEQAAALGWFALADVAVWPQVDGGRGARIADALEHGQEVDLGAAGGRREHATVGAKAAKALLGFATAGQKRVQKPDEPAPDASTLQQAVNEVARLSQDPDGYWTEWLLRVVPAAARMGAS